MSSRAEALAARRQQLQLQCALQREQLRFRHADIESRLSGIDRGVEIARSVIKHPALIVAATAGLVLLGPMKILRWATKGAFIYSAIRRIGGYLKNRESMSYESDALDRPRDDG